MPDSTASDNPGRAPIAILGVPFDNVTTAEALECVGQMIASGKPHYMATANVDFLVQASEDVELRRILFDAHLVVADGMPIVWASGLLGNPLPERVTGSDMIPQLLALAEEKGWRVFFLGGTEASVAAAAEKTRAKHPRLQLVGAYSPPFKPLLEMDNEDILQRLHAAKPDVLLVAFGCPKQEKWINMNYRAAGVPISIGVGATIDFLAGTFRRAPVWMRKTGIEWLFRMLQEPRRLIRRYSRGLWIFGRLILKQFWQLRIPAGPVVPATPAAITTDLPGSMIIKCPPHLDAAEAHLVQADWAGAVEKGNVILDLADTVLVDSTGMGVLIKLRKLAREANHAFVLAAATTPVMSALRLMKLETFFTIEASLSAARLQLREAPGRTFTMTAQSRAAAVELRWVGEVTAGNVAELGATTEARLNNPPTGTSIVIDLARVTFVDSMGIGLMVRLKKNLWRRDIPLVFRNPTASVSNVLRHTKLEDYLLDAPK